MCKKLSGWLISKVCLCASIPYTSLQLATHFSVASDAEDVHDKDIWAPLVMTVQNFFGLHSQPAYKSATSGRFQALVGKRDRTV